MKGLRAKKVRTVKEGTLIATVDIGVTNKGKGDRSNLGVAAE